MKRIVIKTAVIIFAILLVLSLQSCLEEDLTDDIFDSVPVEDDLPDLSSQDSNDAFDDEKIDVPEQIPEDSTFEVHFIDVGQADCALVLCDGMAMLIDGGNAADSSLVYSYLKRHNITLLDYVIATHAHEDHIGGLAGALNFADVGKVYCPTDDYDSEVFESFLKYVNKKNGEIYIPTHGDCFSLGSSDITIVGCNSDDDVNNTSIVLKIVYGETSFLFTGDAEREAEKVILENGYDLKSTVLKVGHHGSENSTTYPFLREIMPEYAVISVGEGNTYGHPHENALSRLEDADVEIYRTDELGTVICTSDGSQVTFTFEKEAKKEEPVFVKQDSPEQDKTVTNDNVESESSFDYILNINTDKFHYPTCSSVKQMSEKNKGYFTGTRSEAISRGYDPCGNCNP